MSNNPRELKGQAIAALGNQIHRINACMYRVNSQSGNGPYLVVQDGEKWVCKCPDHQHRGVTCKHIWAVKISSGLRERVARETVIRPINAAMCPICNSDQIVKHGLRHNGHGDIQRFKCRSCGRWFVVNLGFERMKASPQAITSAMQLYFTGESLRNVQRFLKLQGVKVSHVAVYKWIQKYVSLMQRYLDQITPQVSDVWRADEMYVKIKGDMKYVFALMDDETRFWIAQEVADSKYAHDARKLLRTASAVAGKKPTTFITDGLESYHNAYLKEWRTLRKDDCPRHIRNIRLGGQPTNNKMERLNGEIRDREKVMRGLKRKDTPILTGYQIYHNCVRPHEALKGRTPAEACGIMVEGKDKWLTLIQNASRK
jgi:transposase-like protein